LLPWKPLQSFPLEIGVAPSAASGTGFLMDSRTPVEFTSLPKFLVADDGGDRNFIVHCHYPRFIIEHSLAGEGVLVWIDLPIYDPAHGDAAAQAARLMREAGDFFMKQTSGD
jgi:hypothetical protein